MEFSFTSPFHTTCLTGRVISLMQLPDLCEWYKAKKVEYSELLSIKHHVLLYAPMHGFISAKCQNIEVPDTLFETDTL